MTKPRVAETREHGLCGLNSVLGCAICLMSFVRHPIAIAPDEGGA